MAATFIPIASQTLTGSTAAVTFSAIPQTYTDLVFRISARSDRTGSYDDQLEFRMNGTYSNWSGRYLSGNGIQPSSNPYNYAAPFNTSSTTSATYGSAEIYIPNYRAATNKPISGIGAVENNATVGILQIIASLWSNTAAVTSVTIAIGSATNFVAGSTFHLYGIKATA